jgi:hypothetical protein
VKVKVRVKVKVGAEVRVKVKVTVGVRVRKQETEGGMEIRSEMGARICEVARSPALSLSLGTQGFAGIHPGRFPDGQPTGEQSDAELIPGRNCE